MSDEEVMVGGRLLSSLKVTELKEELDNRGLSTKGVKAVLQERLKEALTHQGDGSVDVADERKRTESETSGADTPQSELSPIKKVETSPTKRTPRKSRRVSNVEAEEKVKEEAIESASESDAGQNREPEKPKEDENKPSGEQEESVEPSAKSANNEGSEVPIVKDEPQSGKEAEPEKPAEVATSTPQTAEKVETTEQPKPVESSAKPSVEKEEVIEKPAETQISKEDDSDELDYGDDEEKDHKEESMDIDDQKDNEKVKIEVKTPDDGGVKKEEKVRVSVSSRRASSPSSRHHAVSSIVHIRGLTRPFTERMLREEIQKHGGEIADFWIDKVKSHCFVKLNTDAKAQMVLNSMHDKTWPDGNPKKLVIVFDTEENMTRYKEGRGEVKLPEVVTIGTLTGSSRAERLSSTSQTSVIGGKASLQITLQNVMRDNDKLDLERKEKRGSLASRLTRIDDKEKPKEQKEDRKRGRSETPPFSRGAGFMDEKKSKREEKERSSKREESRREEHHREERRVVVEEEPQLKTPDQLFKKTSALPALYYMPLTDEQIAAKAAKKTVASSEAETTKAPERSERHPRTDRDRGDRTERDRDRERDLGRERDRDHGRDRPRR